MDFLTEINAKRADMELLKIKISDAQSKMDKTSMESERRIYNQLLDLYNKQYQYCEKRIIDLLAIMDGEP